MVSTFFKWTALVGTIQHSNALSCKSNMDTFYENNCCSHGGSDISPTDANGETMRNLCNDIRQDYQSQDCCQTFITPQNLVGYPVKKEDGTCDLTSVTSKHPFLGTSLASEVRDGWAPGMVAAIVNESSFSTSCPIKVQGGSKIDGDPNTGTWTYPSNDIDFLRPVGPFSGLTDQVVVIRFMCMAKLNPAYPLENVVSKPHAGVPALKVLVHGLVDDAQETFVVGYETPQDATPGSPGNPFVSSWVTPAKNQNGQRVGSVEGACPVDAWEKFEFEVSMNDGESLSTSNLYIYVLRIYNSFQGYLLIDGFEVFTKPDPLL